MVNLSKYYMTTEWNNKKGIEVCWIYKRGEPRHFAIFYDKVKAEEYLEFINK